MNNIARHRLEIDRRVSLMLGAVRRFAAIALILRVLVGANAMAAALQWETFEKLPLEPFRGMIIADSGVTFVVQGSADFIDWLDLATFSSEGRPIYFEDDGAGALERRFYRLAVKSGGPESLSGEVNSVFIPNEGFNVVQATSDGRFVLILWHGSNLICFQERAKGVWEKSVITSGSTFKRAFRDEHRFQPLAALLINSQDVPQVFVLRNRSIEHYEFLGGGKWSSKTPILIPSPTDPVLFAAASGPGDVIHFALGETGSPAQIRHGSNQGGFWKWTIAATLRGHPRGFFPQSYAPRYFSLAVDGTNAAHLTYCQEFRVTWGERGAEIYSELGYASNALLGIWAQETVQVPDDSSGDAGTGASIAIAPDGRPAIASWYNERAATGSSQWSQLFYHKKNLLGVWTNSVIARYPDGYQAGDGVKGTGFAPYLRFDDLGDPHVVFSDHASEHFEASGQNEFAGQIRHSHYQAGRWTTETIYRQVDPLRQQIIYPSFAMKNGRTAFVGLEWTTIWNHNVWPREVDSQYRLVWILR